MQDDIKLDITPIPIKEDNIFGEVVFQKRAKEREQNLEDYMHPDLLAMENVTLQKFDKREYTRGLVEGEKPFPVTPRISPYEVKDPIIGGKTYRWCSCGMSKSQPFCDDSHVGTKFKALRFRVEENVESMHLCG